MAETRYLYDGELSPQVADYIRSALREYPNAIEIKSFPDIETINKLLPIYHWQERSAVGERYWKTSRKYCLVSKSLTEQVGMFMFVSTLAEKTSLISGMPDLIVNPHPFRTII